MGTGGWSVINYPLPPRHKESLDCGFDPTIVLWYVVPCVWISSHARAFQRVMTLPINEFVVPDNGKVGNQILSLLTLLLVRVSLRLTFFLLNRPSLASNVQKVRHKPFNERHNLITFHPLSPILFISTISTFSQ